MKKVLILVVFIFVSMQVFSNKAEHDYIVTNDPCFHFKKVRHGIGANSYLVGILDNGDKLRFSREQVIKYRINGYVYEKAPVIYNNIKSGDYDFMKIVCKRDEMTLYEYNECTACNKKHHKRFYVFRKERFVIELCSHTQADLLAKFTSAN